MKRIALAALLLQIRQSLNREGAVREWRRWEPSNGLPGLKDLYLSILPRLYEVAPDALFLIEGTGQSMNKANWGDGFNTDKATIAEWGISDPTAFLDVSLPL